MTALLKESEVASWLNVSLAALQRWRFEGRGPQFVKIGASVRYDPAKVRDWIASCPTGGGKK
jgi:predicted DNA-binding transcriptional regulator AlpA